MKTSSPCYKNRGQQLSPEMKLTHFIVCILVGVICILLGLLQHFYITNQQLYKRAAIRHETPLFEDLIPSNGKPDYVPPQVEVSTEAPGEKEDDLVLNDLTTFLHNQPKTYDYCMKSQNQIQGIAGDSEVDNILQAAMAYKQSGKLKRAKKLFDHAAAIAPENADVLTKYGEFLEEAHQDYITADDLYFKVIPSHAKISRNNIQYLQNIFFHLLKALTYSPEHKAALINHQRSAQIVEGLDFKLFQYIDFKTKLLRNQIQLDSFETMKKQAYYLHIYHTVGIEGNTMTVKQLRYLLETGNVVSGKSIIEHNEVLGLEKALQYIKLLVRREYICVEDILEVHRRVMGHVDPIESGAFRTEKVFVGGHVPPSHEEIPGLMNGYVEWLNSEEAKSMHPVRYAALAHYKLVDIHPFVDGNGRTSRLIMNLILLKFGYPPVMILKEQRELYYDSLKTANMGDVRPFVRFIAQCTIQILGMYITNTHLSIGDESDSEVHSVINLDKLS